MPVRQFAFFAALLFLARSVVAQEDALAPGMAALPRSFRGFNLGMGLDELKATLAADNEFVFRGDRDVSFLPDSNQNLVDSAGRGMIKRAFFQLKDGAVFVMAFDMNTEKIDHYSVFTAFSAKYGGPLALNPRQSEWEDTATRVFIERPLTVKYIDKNVFDGIVSESRAGESSAVMQRQELLEEF
ncbi:MAG: hypothetical protein LBH50_01675 [Spirochaetaceae bacterium]|jgi:hypothetical protein|nr:hypothetical protein [Spirochaetaceae bacterium]